MKAKKIAYMVIMRAYDVDNGSDYEVTLFEKREDAHSYWKEHVDIEMFDKEMSWVANAYDNGNYDHSIYTLCRAKDYLSFRSWDKEVVWSIEEKEVY